MAADRLCKSKFRLPVMAAPLDDGHFPYSYFETGTQFIKIESEKRYITSKKLKLNYNRNTLRTTAVFSLIAKNVISSPTETDLV